MAANAGQTGTMTPASVNPPQPNCTIFITGEVNSGKSSLLNALSGGIVSNASLQRETFNPIEYEYSKQGTEANLRKLSEQLQDVHKKNESLRKELHELSEEKVATTTRFEFSLPVRYELAPCSLVDFPGINDAEDGEKQLFFAAISNKVHEADLIIFVTDAATAFSKASEINEYRKVQQLVQRENDVGHFVELVVVVNKFDTTGDKDLEDIFDRIPSKLSGFEKDKVFRFSSHKMLIDNVLRCELDVYLPVFHRNELQRILRTCNVQLSSSAQGRIKKERLLRFSDINVQADLANAVSDDEEEDGESSDGEEGETDEETSNNAVERLRTGEYYKLIEFLRQFQIHLNKKRVDIAQSFLGCKWTELKDLCVHRNGRESVEPVLKTLMAKLERFDTLGAKRVYEERLLKELTALGELHIAGNWLTHNNQLIADVLKVFLVFIWHKSKDGKQALAIEEPVDIITHMQTNSKRFAIDIHHTFAYFFVLQPRHSSRTVIRRQTFWTVPWSEAFRDWLVNFASDSRTFTQKEWESFKTPSMQYPCTLSLNGNSPRLTYVIETKPKSVRILSSNPVVQSLLTMPNVPVQVRMLLKLALTPLVYINEMDRSQQLPYELLEEVLPGAIRPLRLLMLQPALFDPQQPLLHRLFKMEEHFSSLLASHNVFVLEWELLATELRTEKAGT